MIKQLLSIAFIGALAFNVHVAQAADGGNPEALRQEIIKIMLVNPKTTVKQGGKDAYLDNINSVRENQNKIKLNAATRAIALGRRAVALATQSGEDVNKSREAIESNDDVLNMLKDIAKLQAQHLQKINEITAMRAKMLELNSIESIMAGDVATTDEDALKNGGNSGSGS